LEAVRETILTQDQFTDEAAVEAVLEWRGQKAAAADNLKRAEKGLEERLRARSGRPIETEDLVARLSPVRRTEYDYPTLLGLREVAEEHQIMEVALQNPSGGFLEAIAERFGYRADRIIAEAKTRIDDGEEKLKITKRKKSKGGDRSRSVD